MTDLTRERILSLTRHIMTGGSGGTVGVSAMPGDPVLFGWPLSLWLGLLTLAAGCVNAWCSKGGGDGPV
jgi:hypothetical protein